MLGLRRILAVAIALHALGAIAWGNPAVLRKQLSETAQRTGTPTYTRKMANGVERVYVNPSGPQQLRGMEAVLHGKSNVLEIMHSGAPGSMHTLAVFNRKFLHMQYQGAFWRMRNWSGETAKDDVTGPASEHLRQSGTPMYSALIHLTPSEAMRLQSYIEEAAKQQGPEVNAGAGWANGHLQNAFGHLAGQLNCTSHWSQAPIGDHGEQLWQLVGLPFNPGGSPPGFQRALETSGNDRVFGISLYGPPKAGFGTNSGVDQFFSPL